MPANDQVVHDCACYNNDHVVVLGFELCTRTDRYHLRVTVGLVLLGVKRWCSAWRSLLLPGRELGLMFAAGARRGNTVVGRTRQVSAAES